MIALLDASRARALAALSPRSRADNAAVALNGAELTRNFATTALDHARSYEPT